MYGFIATPLRVFIGMRLRQQLHVSTPLYKNFQESANAAAAAAIGAFAAAAAVNLLHFKLCKFRWQRQQLHFKWWKGATGSRQPEVWKPVTLLSFLHEMYGLAKWPSMSHPIQRWKGRAKKFMRHLSLFLSLDFFLSLPPSLFFSLSLDFSLSISPSSLSLSLSLSLLLSSLSFLYPSFAFSIVIRNGFCS